VIYTPHVVAVRGVSSLRPRASKTDFIWPHTLSFRKWKGHNAGARTALDSGRHENPVGVTSASINCCWGCCSKDTTLSSTIELFHKFIVHLRKHWQIYMHIHKNKRGRYSHVSTVRCLWLDHSVQWSSTAAKAAYPSSVYSIAVSLTTWPLSRLITFSNPLTSVHCPCLLQTPLLITQETVLITPPSYGLLLFRLTLLTNVPSTSVIGRATKGSSVAGWPNPSGTLPKFHWLNFISFFWGNNTQIRRSMTWLWFKR
jgi:hypothetical protein